MSPTLRLFLWSCVAQVLSSGDGARHSSHDSASYRENNIDFIFVASSFLFSLQHLVCIKLGFNRTNCKSPNVSLL